MNITLIKIGNDNFPASEEDILAMQTQILNLNDGDSLVTNHTVTIENIEIGNPSESMINNKQIDNKKE